MKRKRYLAATIWILISIHLIAGCTSGNPTPASSGAQTVTLTDDVGRVVTIEGKVERIISLAPSNTEILFALGLDKRVVAVTQYCDYPPAATQIEKVGTLRQMNYETIVGLDPDLILASGLTRQEVMAKLEELGLTVVVLRPDDIEGIFTDIKMVGQMTGTQDRADKVVAELRARWESLLAKMENVSRKPRVFLEIDSKLYTAGPGTFLDALINMAGGTNIAADSVELYPQISVEEIVGRDPEVIILADDDQEVTPEMAKARPGWKSITAVKNGAIYPIDASIIDRAGPRIIDGLEELTKMIHPELWLTE